VASPGFGQFAGSFADAFSRTIGQSEDKKRKDELAKQQAKLIELRLQAGQIKIDASTTLADLMTGTLEEFEQAEPTLTPGGLEKPQFSNTSQDPLSLIDILSGDSPEGQLAALQSGAVSGGDLLDFQTAQDKLAAQPDISQLMGNLTPDEKGNPPFIMGGITFGPRGPEQSFIRNPEFSTKQQDDLSRSSLSQLTTDVIEAVSIGGDIEGSLLESGFPFGEQARTGKSAIATLGGLLGFDTKEQKQDVAKFDRLDKLNGMILNLRLKRLIDSGENITNDKLAFQQSISPSSDKRFETNTLLYADFLQEELNIADIEGPKVSADERKKILDFIRKARSGGFAQQADQEPIVDTPGAIEGASAAFGKFKDFTMEQIQGVDIPSLPQEQIDSFRSRFEQLKQQSEQSIKSGITAVQDTATPSSNQKLLAKIALMKSTLAAASVLEKVKVGIAKASDFAELTIEEIKQIDKEDIEEWTEEQKKAFNKRRKELGL